MLGKVFYRFCVMRALTITDSEEMILVLQDEIRRSEQSRYDHRLHGVLLVAQGMSAHQVAGYLGDSPRTVQNWVRRLNEEGLIGLTETPGRGRPGRLSESQLKELGTVLRASPRRVGMEANLWDGKTLRHWLQEHWQVEMSVRQCQRIFRQLGFRQRKPRPVLAHADPLAQAAHKKTPPTGDRPGG